MEFIFLDNSALFPRSPTKAGCGELTCPVADRQRWDWPEILRTGCVGPLLAVLIAHFVAFSKSATSEKNESVAYFLTTGQEGMP